MTMIKLKDRKQKCEECLNKLKRHDTVVGALAIVLFIGVLVTMVLDAKAETITILEPDGQITQCFVDSTNIVVCI